MKFHPIAELFPLIEGEEFEKLVVDIRENGLVDPIITFEGMILDGRNRWRACEIANCEPRLEEFEGADSVAFVLSKNLLRRHLTKSQAGMIANQMARLPWGGNKGNKLKVSGNTLTQEQAAKAFDVSPKFVAIARRVEREAPELVEPIKRGEMTIGTALKQVKEKANGSQTKPESVSTTTNGGNDDYIAKLRAKADAKVLDWIDEFQRWERKPQKQGRELFFAVTHGIF